MEKIEAYIGSIATALPPCKIEQSKAAQLVRHHYATVLRPRSMEMLVKVLSHPSIASRYFAIDRMEDITILKDEDPDARIARFTRWSVELAISAARKTLQNAGVAPREISAIVVNTCTGYICPGIATYCIEPLGLRPDVVVYDCVGAGCGGALPNLQLGASLVRSGIKGPVLCVSVEICSATYQMDNDPSLLISNAIFGDGAAAALVWNKPRGLHLAAFASQYLPAFRDEVRYVHKNGQLFNRITPQLPKIIKQNVPTFIRGFLQQCNLNVNAVEQWALHPGGDKMVAGLQEELQLSDAHLEPTRRILREAGNMSSPTVLFILEILMQQPIGRVCLCAYGAGLSMHACLLEGECSRDR